jgi:hypothetical protein
VLWASTFLALEVGEVGFLLAGIESVRGDTCFAAFTSQALWPITPAPFMGVGERRLLTSGQTAGRSDNANWGSW